MKAISINVASGTTYGGVPITSARIVEFERDETQIMVTVTVAGESRDLADTDFECSPRGFPDDEALGELTLTKGDHRDFDLVYGEHRFPGCDG